ncbi:hypothetical protein [Streptomyces sp. NPDC049040]|uniref:hypothetical protein n=1 Tax=Streptomyces sp. NPDC049040 TaxID=3365593 RepID=UPI003714214A
MPIPTALALVLTASAGTATTAAAADRPSVEMSSFLCPAEDGVMVQGPDVPLVVVACRGE